MLTASGDCGPATRSLPLPAPGAGEGCVDPALALWPPAWSAFFAFSTALWSLGAGSSEPPTPGVITYVGPELSPSDGVGIGGGVNPGGGVGSAADADMLPAPRTTSASTVPLRTRRITRPR